MSNIGEPSLHDSVLERRIREHEQLRSDLMDKIIAVVLSHDYAELAEMSDILIEEKSEVIKRLENYYGQKAR